MNEGTTMTVVINRLDTSDFVPPRLGWPDCCAAAGCLDSVGRTVTSKAYVRNKLSDLDTNSDTTVKKTFGPIGVDTVNPPNEVVSSVV